MKKNRTNKKHIPTAEDIKDAIDKFNSMGFEAVSKWGGFKPSIRYIVVYKGKEYPSKAIWGLATNQFSNEFSGGEELVRRIEKTGLKGLTIKR